MTRAARSTLVLALLTGASACRQPAARPVPAPATAPTPAPAQDGPALRVAVDRRVEAMSILWALAGAPEYTRGPATPYRRAMVAHFGPFATHPAVAAAQALRAQHGISHEAPVLLALYLTDALTPRRPLDPALHGLGRFAGVDLEGFVAQVRAFAADARLDDFLRAQGAQTRGVEQRFRDFLANRPVVGWYDRTFGPRPGATYVLAPGMVTGLHSYGGYAERVDGGQDIAVVLSLDDLDAEGLPRPGDLALGLVVHELGHAYVNPVVDAALARLEPAAAPAIARAADAMRRQEYTTTQIALEESVVRATVALYMGDRVDTAHRDAQIRDETARGFAWTADLADALLRARDAAGGLAPEALVAATRAGFGAYMARGVPSAP